jgi:hypothetical protein
MNPKEQLKSCPTCKHAPEPPLSPTCKACHAPHFAGWASEDKSAPTLPDCKFRAPDGPDKKNINRRIQEKIFSLGGSWNDGSMKVRDPFALDSFVSIEYYCIRGGRLSYGFCGGVYAENPLPEIPYQQILDMGSVLDTLASIKVSYKAPLSKFDLEKWEERLNGLARATREDIEKAEKRGGASRGDGKKAEPLTEFIPGKYYLSICPAYRDAGDPFSVAGMPRKCLSAEHLPQAGETFYKAEFEEIEGKWIYDVSLFKEIENPGLYAQMVGRVFRSGVQCGKTGTIMNWLDEIPPDSLPTAPGSDETDNLVSRADWRELWDAVRIDISTRVDPQKMKTERPRSFPSFTHIYDEMPPPSPGYPKCLDKMMMKRGRRLVDISWLPYYDVMIEESRKLKSKGEKINMTTSTTIFYGRVRYTDGPDGAKIEAGVTDVAEYFGMSESEARQRYVLDKKIEPEQVKDLRYRIAETIWNKV